MKQLYIFLAVGVLYVHLFNAVTHMYFESGQTLTLEQLYRKVVPPTDLHIRL